MPTMLEPEVIGRFQSIKAAKDMCEAITVSGGYAVSGLINGYVSYIKNMPGIRTNTKETISIRKINDKKYYVEKKIEEV